jgi:hypothetical protein
MWSERIPSPRQGEAYWNLTDTELNLTDAELNVVVTEPYNGYI